MVASEGDLTPLDGGQVARIEGVHRGFFYQHLYAVAVLLALGRADGTVLVVEVDEDIELIAGDDHRYLQVKTRLGTLQPSAIAGALARFDKIRAEHAAGKRQGQASFAIVADAEPSPLLAQRIAQVDWPQDVELVTPARPSAIGLPAAGSDIDAMLAIATGLAGDVPFAGLAPATLVFKLAALVQQAATGAHGHRFAAEDLPDLLEQLVVQLQDFPEPPSPYFPQRDEPHLSSDHRVRLIVGFSGAGKTAWAAEAARHSPDALIYFDVGDLPSRSVPTNLAREIVARFLGGREKGAGGMQLPPNGGLDALRYADQQLAEQGMRVTVVLDNVHRLAADDLRQIEQAAPHHAFLCLGQPWNDRALAEATLGIEAEALGGLGPDAVAAVFALEEVALDVPTAETVIALTGGLPLFVINAALLTARQFAGSASDFCAAITARTHLQETAQDLILEGAFAGLSPIARDVAGLLGLCEVPLEPEETTTYLAGLGAATQIAQALRELRRASMLVNHAQSRIGLHDALRPLAAGHREAMAEATIAQALQALEHLLIASLHRHQDIPRLTALVRLLPRVGHTDALVDLATSEMFYEQGNMAMMWDTLVEASDNPAYTPNERFWALDALAYWGSRDGGIPGEKVVAQMADLVAANDFEPRERLNLIFKQLITAGSAGDRKRIEELYRAGRKLADDRDVLLILRYNRAVALYRTDALPKVRDLLEELIADMFKALGLRENDLLFKNGPALIEALGDSDHDALKRLADALNLWSTVMVRMGLPPVMRRIQASKLYASVGAGRSAAVAAQEMADEMMKIMATAEGAREVFEQHVFPLIEHYQLTDLVLEARGEYAVALAYCGDFTGADREMAALANYGGDDEWLEKRARAAVLIEAIRIGAAVIGPPMHPPGGLNALLNPNAIGRRLPSPDAPCPCGKGRKYKRCCGRK